MRNIWAFMLIVGLGSSCGKKDTPPVGSTRDFTRYDLVQLKSATGLGVSGTRYDLTLADKTVKKFIFTSENGYQADRTYTMNEAAKSTLNLKLKSVPTGAYSQCADAVCAANRPSVWIELPNTDPPSYFFSNEGDCSCPDDGENAPTLQYAAMNAIYQDILALFAK